MGGYGAKGNPLYFVIQFCWEPKTTLKRESKGNETCQNPSHIIPRVFIMVIQVVLILQCLPALIIFMYLLSNWVSDLNFVSANHLSIFLFCCLFLSFPLMFCVYFCYFQFFACFIFCQYIFSAFTVFYISITSCFPLFDRRFIF